MGFCNFKIHRVSLLAALTVYHSIESVLATEVVTYPATPGEPLSADFDVWADGKPGMEKPSADCETEATVPRPPLCIAGAIMRANITVLAWMLIVSIGVYVHRARKDNTVWYDGVVLSTGYLGPEAES
jgi:hypothetical protein